MMTKFNEDVMKRQLSNSIVILMALAAALMAGVPGAVAQLAASHTQTTAVAPQPATLSAPTDKPVARVNGTVLTDRDLTREMYTLFPYAREHNGQLPAELVPQLRAGALKMIVFEELVYQDAVQRGVSVSPVKLQKAEADFRGQFNSPDQYKQFLNVEFNGSEKALHQKIRRSLVIEAALKSEVDNRSTVTLAELRAFYDKNPARFEYPEAFAFQTISFLPPEKPTTANLAELRKRAENGLEQAKAAKGYEQFGVLAEKISEDDYRVMMGDHKAVERSKLAPQVVEALLAIKPGEITGIIQVEQAYTIVRLIQHIPAGKRTFEQVKDPLRKELEKRKTEEVRAALDKRLRKAAKVEEM
jgi:peptidyl-prolyl cis-trans isomerase SurA